MFEPIVICADIGSVKNNNFAWWSASGDSGTTPSSLASNVAYQLNASRPVALGFECPLFVPLAEDELDLTKARLGEGSRAWSAGAGCGALATGLVQVTWVLQAIRQKLSSPSTAFLEWTPFKESGTGLLIWEAFVTGSGKGSNHIEDARAGTMGFIRALPEPDRAMAITINSPVYSLVGAALLRTGWSADVGILNTPCIVMRP
jgi:hypothetical protein